MGEHGLVLLLLVVLGEEVVEAPPAAAGQWQRDEVPRGEAAAVGPVRGGDPGPGHQGAATTTKQAFVPGHLSRQPLGPGQ